MTDPEITSADRLMRLAHEPHRATLAAARDQHGSAARPAPNRVPFHGHEENLRRLVSESRAAGITPFLITAPTNHAPGHEPPSLAKRHLRALSELSRCTPPTWRRRAGSRARPAPTCGRRGGIRGAAAHYHYFLADGIHPTGAGDEEMAKVVSGCLMAAPRPLMSGGRETEGPAHLLAQRRRLP